VRRASRSDGFATWIWLARLCFCQPPQSFDAAIRRTVIYEHQLDLIPSKGLSKNGGQNPLDEVPRIEDGNDDADLDCHTLKPLITARCSP